MADATVGSKFTVTREFTTGKLGALAVEPVQHEARADGAKRSAELKDATKRVVWIGYQVPSKPKSNMMIPYSFSILCPVVSLADVQAVDRGAEFLTDLFRDHQDRMLHQVADGKSDINPCDLSALVTDYYDTTRGSGLTAKKIADWAKDVFAVAFTMRQLSNNASGSVKVKTDAEIATLAKNYCNWISGVCSGTAAAAVNKTYVLSLRQVLDKLAEDGIELLDADDVIYAHVRACCVTQLAVDAEVVADSI